MSANLINKLREALLNNSYDHSSMKTALQKAWENSYSYLYGYQKSVIEYEEFFYYSGDDISHNSKLLGRLYYNKFLRACFNLGYELIQTWNREEFYHSEFYHKPFSIEDMIINPSIFNKIPIIMIDDCAIWDYTIQRVTDKFVVVLPFDRTFVINIDRNAETDDIVYKEHKIQVLIVDNIFYERIRINRNNLTISNSNKTIAINPNLLTNNTLETRRGIYFLSFHIPNYYNNQILKGSYELGTMIYPCEINDGQLICQLTDTDFDRISNARVSFFISLIFINRLRLHKFYTESTYTTCSDGECNLFVLQSRDRQPYAMPIPVENLMIYKISQSTGQRSLVKNVDSVEMYYPNIYRIKDIDRVDGDIYQVFYFYKPAQDLAYSIIFDYFNEYLNIRFPNYTYEETIDKLYRGVADTSSFNGDELEEFMRTLNKLLEYQYYRHNYGDIDFVKRYKLLSGNEDKDPFEYEEETLRSWINNNPRILRDYVLEQNKLGLPIYHLWTNALDLNNRYRTSTTPELGSMNGFDLPEPCYVFSFRNDNTTSGVLLNARIFVDGIFVVNMHQTRHYFTDYFYIPVSLVTDDSYIEIEIFPSYVMHTEPFRLTSPDDVKIITLAEPENGIYPTAQDLYYMAPSGHIYSDITGQEDTTNTSEEVVSLIYKDKVYYETPLFDDSSFEVVAVYDDKEFEVKTIDEDKPVKFTRLSTFKVKAKPGVSSVLNRDIILTISKKPHGIEYIVKEDGYTYIPLVETQFKYHINYLRIFRNGRLVPRQKYVFYSSHSMPRIVFADWLKKDEIIYIDITPYQYREVYYLSELDPNNTLIDLKGIINKPFDIRYFDVYMNGRKLGLNNVFAISPWEITLVNLKSLHNLQIFEKERDYEYFGTKYDEMTYYFTIDDLLNSSFIREDERNELIKRMIDMQKDPRLNIYPNENDEDVIDYTDLRYFMFVHRFYYDELIPKTFVNPDRLQFSEEVVSEEYPNIFAKYVTHPSQSSRTDAELTRRQNYELVLSLDPDAYIEGGVNAGKVMYVYTVGHLNEVNESLLNQTPAITHDKPLTE